MISSQHKIATERRPQFRTISGTKKSPVSREAQLTAIIHENRQQLETIVCRYQDRIPELRKISMAQGKAEKVGKRYLCTPKRFQQLDDLFNHLLKDGFVSDEMTMVARRGKKLIGEMSEAVKDLVKDNLKTAEAVGRRYGRDEMSRSDLTQEGIIGLMSAAYRFDTKFGVLFRTYAEHYAKQRIIHALQDLQTGCRLPAHFLQYQQRFTKSVSTLEQKLNREPTDQEIATHMGVTVKTISLLREKAAPVLSTDFVYEDTGINTLDTFASVEIEMTKKMESEQLSVDIKNFLGQLPKRDREILMVHFGFVKEDETLLNHFGYNGGETVSYKDIAQKIGVSQERVRQIAMRGLRMLQALGGQALKSHFSDAPCQ